MRILLIEADAATGAVFEEQIRVLTAAAERDGQQLACDLGVDRALTARPERSLVGSTLGHDFRSVRVHIPSSWGAPRSRASTPPRVAAPRTKHGEDRRIGAFESGALAIPPRTSRCAVSTTQPPALAGAVPRCIPERTAYGFL